LLFMQLLSWNYGVKYDCGSFPDILKANLRKIKKIYLI